MNLHKDQPSTLIINLYLHQSGVYLPELYKVSLDENGIPAHIIRKEKPETLMQAETQAVRQNFFQSVHALQPPVITRKYIRKPRRHDELAKLLEDKQNGHFIKEYIDRYMQQVLTYATENNVPISLGLNRNALISSYLLEYIPEPLIPKLFFRKTGEGLIYRLEIMDGKGRWDIQRHEPVTVCNRPAWVAAKGKLRRVKHINALMLKPFVRKDHLIIPGRTVKSYFEKFILKVSRQVDIEAEGFEVVKDNKLENVSLEPYHHFIDKEWELVLKFHYAGTTFSSHDKRQNKINISFEGDEIRLHKTERNPEAEQHYVRLLTRYGLKIAHNGNLKPGPAFKEQYGHLLNWLGRHRKELTARGFQIINPVHKTKEIILVPYELSLQTDSDNDWFDLNAVVRVGDHEFPFTELKDHILQGNPYYELPDGTWFFIPPEWMTHYAGLFQFGETKGGHLRLLKNQFPLLEEAGISLPETEGEALPPIHLPLGLQARLRPYQEEGFRWLAGLYHKGLGGILADDMGLGKTLQSIALLLYVKQLKNQPEGTLFPLADDKPLQALVVMPASLVYNWQAELKKFAPGLRVYVHAGAGRTTHREFLSAFDVILTTYQTALRDMDMLAQGDYEIVILDESQQIKNRQSKTFQALKRLSARQKITLTGTPIENSLSDLWSQMAFVNPGLLGSYAFFEREFLRPIEKQGDEEKKDLLRVLIKPYILRRTKKEVEKSLPDLQIITQYCTMTEAQRRLYEEEKSAMRNYLLDILDNPSRKREWPVHTLQALMRLRQIANHPRLVMPDYEADSGKFERVMTELEKIAESGSKALIFSSFVKHLDLVKEALERRGIPYAYLTGQQSRKEREAMVQRFEHEPRVKVFLISIKAGGTGLNLTAADYVLILDPWWNPKVEQQAIARAHRIGRERKVIAVKFITKDTLEEKILKLQEKKDRLADDILDVEKWPEWSREEIGYLLE